ncbi:MAG TPA: ATPase, T2SS/T4P/T4SS family, partial [Methanomicrobiales archaeon]|nr:ATPase, T2SS/T4P/T4SS family [Methanomicrobiales archaeon]
MTKEPEKRQELDAMMKRLGLLGIEGREARPGGPGSEGTQGQGREPPAPAQPAQGKAQADELKDLLKQMETLEKDGARKVLELSGESDSVMARLEKLDIANLGKTPGESRGGQAQALEPENMQASEPAQAGEPAPARAQAPKRDEEFLALIRGIEEVKRDLVPNGQGKQVARKEIRAEKLGQGGEAEVPRAEQAGQGEAENTSILDRLEKLDLTNVGGETKTDLSDIAAWKKEIRKEGKVPAPAQREATPRPTQAAQGGDAAAILKRLEGLVPEEPAAPAPKARPARREAVTPQPPQATQSGQEIDPEAILRRLEALSPEEARAVAQKVAPVPRQAVPQPAPEVRGVDAAAILKRFEGTTPAAEPKAAPRKAPAVPAPQAREGGDADAQSLLKRLGGVAPPEQRVAGKSKWEPAAPAAEEPKAAATAPRTPAREGAKPGTGKDGSEKDVTSVIDTIFKVHKGAPMGVPTDDVDASLKQIIDEEAKAGAAAEDEKEATHAKKTRWSEGEQEAGQEAVVSVDEIKDISNLILPKGATFAIDEVKLHERTSVFDVKGGNAIPSEIAESWQSQLPSGVIKDIVIGKEAAEEVKSRGILGKLNIMKVIRKEVEEYNPRVHGPLVDLAWRAAANIEEVEVYPVNEPYAYIRVLHDNSTHEYTYTVLEPVLNPAEKELIGELKQRLFETLEVNTKDLTKEAAHRAIRGAVDTVLSDYGISLTPVAREKILYNIEKEFLGDGIVDPIMHDKYIEDISCDGVNIPIFVYHTSYENTKTNLTYKEAADLDSFVTKMAQRAGKHISIAEPILDATMPDGSRIQMTLGSEVTAHGSTFTIRKFREEPITPTDLIEWSTFSPLAVAFLWLAVESGKSAIFAGGTASGKTTSLNAISLFIPPMAKIVSLEDTRELKLPHPNWIPSITRDSFDTNGKGEIDMYELLRAALRQRPEYLIVGEIRGKEALTLFQAMSTGHVTYATMHADSVASVVHRIENPPLSVPRNMLSALNLVCVQAQARIGGQRIRRSKQIIEILDIDPRTNELITNEVFRWHPTTDEIRYSGKSYILEEIMEERGWSEARMKEELKR